MIKLTIPGYNNYGHYDRDATLEEVMTWLQEKGVGEIERVLPSLCRHGHPTMHDGGEFACAGPIAEAKKFLIIPLEEK